MLRSPTCPNCCRNFGTQDPSRPHGPRIPLLLRCGHTFCEGCLTKLGKSKTSIPCPKCQVITPLGEHGVKELWPDVYVLGLLALNRKVMFDGDVLMKLSQLDDGKTKRRKKRAKKVDASEVEDPESTEEVCDECGKKPATCHCVKCESNMCGVCFDKVHKASKILMKHQAIPLHNMNITSFGVSCSVHPARTVELYCIDDEVAICTNCAIFGDHRQHKITSMEEKNRDIASEIEPAVQVAKETIDKLKSADRLLSEAIPEVKHNVAHITQEIRLHFRILHGLLQVREQILVENLEESGVSKVEPLEDMRDSISINLKKLSLLIDNVQRAKKTGNELVLSAKELVVQLSTSQDIPCNVVPNENADQPDFQFSIDRSINGTLGELGQIESRAAPRYTLKSSNELPGDWVPPPLPRRQTSPSSQTTYGVTTAAGTSTADTELNRSEPDSVKPDAIVTPVSQKSRTSPRSRIARKLAKNAKASQAYNELVHVTHIESPCHFKVQRCSDSDRFEAMKRALNKHCNDKKAETVDEVEPGNVYCCQYAIDKMWCRVRVRKLIEDDDEDDDCDEDRADVVYIDYGTTEVVPLSRLRKIKSKYMNVPDLAVTCSLVDIVPSEKNGKWSTEAIHTFVSMAGHKPIFMTVLNHSGALLYVDLHKPPSDDIDNDVPVSVRDALVFLEVARFDSPASNPIPGMPPVTPPRKFIKPSMPMKGDYVDSTVSHIISAGDFYIQKVGPEVHHLARLTQEMQTTFNVERGDVWQILCPSEGMICAAKYDLDNTWYRAVIIGLPGNHKVKVMYADFGNTEVVDYTKLQKIPDDFCRLPVQAIRCSMADIAPLGDGWTDVDSHKLQQLVQYKPLVAHVQDVVDKVPSVLLYDTSSDVDVCINAVLVKEGLAVSTGPGSDVSKAAIRAAPQEKTETDEEDECRVVGPVGSAKKHPAKYKPKIKPPDYISYTEVLVSHIESPFCIYVQLATAEEDGLDDLMKNMTSYYSKQLIYEDIEWTDGDICAALFVQGEVWCRAKIVALLPGDLCVVIYTDFGNSEVVALTNLRKLNREFSLPSPFAICCYLAGLQPAGGKTWTKTACEFLITLICGVQCFLVNKKDDYGSGMLPMDLLYEVPEDVKPESPADSTEGVLLSVAKTLILQGLALPVKTLSSQTFSPDQMSSIGIVGKRIDDKSNENSVMKAKAVSLIIKSEHASDRTPSDGTESEDATDGIFDDADSDAERQMYDLSDESSAAGGFGLVRESSSGRDDAAAGDVRSEEMPPLSFDLNDQKSDENNPVEEEHVQSVAAVEEHSGTSANQQDDGSDRSGPRVSELDGGGDMSSTPVGKPDGKAQQLMPDGGGDRLGTPGKNDGGFRHGMAATLYGGGGEMVGTSVVKTDGGVRRRVAAASQQDGSGDRVSPPVAKPESGIKRDAPAVCPDGGGDRVGTPGIQTDSVVLISSGIRTSSPLIASRSTSSSPVTCQDDSIRRGKSSPVSDVCADRERGASPIIKTEDAAPQTLTARAGSPPVLPQAELGGSVAKPTLGGGRVKSGTHLKLQYLPPVVPTKDVIKFSVTYVDSDGMIYGHEIREENETLIKVMHNLQEKFGTSDLLADDYEWKIGQLCSAQFTDDKQWYRAKIVDITDTGVEVLYVDFGNSEVVNKQVLRDEVVDMDIPQHCLECQLHGITPNSGSGKWCKEAIYFLTESLLGNVFTVYVKTPPIIGKPLQVDVKLENSPSLLEVLVHQGWARCFSDSLVIKDVNANPLKSVYKQPQLPEYGDYFPVTVTHISNPGSVCIQRLGSQGSGDSPGNDAVEDLEELERISSEMNEHADEFDIIENPVPGMACCGQYTFDDEWYRAEILKVKSLSPLTVQVGYVDYGTTEVIPVERLKKLPEEFKSLPVQAVQCEVVGLKPPSCVPSNVELVAGTPWPVGSLHALTSLVMDHRMMATVKKEDNKLKALLFTSTPTDQVIAPLAFQPLIEQGLGELDTDAIDKSMADLAKHGVKSVP